LPKELANEIWRDLITGANNEDQLIGTPKWVIPTSLIEKFLQDVNADIEGYLAPEKRTEEEPLASGGNTQDGDGGQAEAEWVKRLASEVNDLVRKPDILKRFHEMMKQWQARYREQAECNRQWTKRREQHFETLAALPEDDPRRKDSPTPPEPGWVREVEDCVPSGGQLMSIGGWIPPDLAVSREPEVETILPLVERALRLDEKYTLLAAVHDSDLRGATRIAPWPDSDLEAIPYAALLRDLPDEIEGAQHELRAFFEDVKQDAERARQERDEKAAEGGAASGRAAQNLVFHGPVEKVIVQHTEKGRNTIIENSPKTDVPQSTWVNGSFYLFAFLLIVVFLAVLVKWVPWYALPVVPIVAILIVVLIGVLELRRDNLLSEKGFLEVVRMVFAKLPLIERLSRKKRV
jgi:hypothetical protein